MRKKSTLRRQFFIRILAVMVTIAAITGGIQVWVMSNNVQKDIDQQAAMISESIRQGIKETDTASLSIEHQIDLKLESYAKRIADKLRGKSIDQITNDQLSSIRDEVGVAGITLFVRTKEDIVGARATDPKEIGFSIKGLNPYAYQMFDLFMSGQKLPDEAANKISFLSNNMLTLYISQSGSHGVEPAFFKYGYYRSEDLDYLIDPYIEADEVYKFMQDVGPDSWIKQVLERHPYAMEIAVLDPRVFADPSLAENMYPPLTKVVNGKYTFENSRDTQILVDMMKSPTAKAYRDKGTYKVFSPIKEDRVLYIALDYDKMAWPIYRHAIIIAISGFVSLIALFMLTASFFSRIYSNIQKIMKQIARLEAGDITAKSELKDKGELGSLSESANKMVDSLNHVLTDTYDTATRAQRLAFMLETESNQSVEKAFTLSMENTSKVRGSVEEVYYFLDQIKEHLEAQDHAKSRELLEKVEQIRDIAKERSNSTTDITITLSDLFKSLHAQSTELSDISGDLLEKLAKFKL
ncbi:methyl-accepting chemotaxis protein [Cohnella pontilimi]|uniref:Methyl-accepting chemotaxis protein n=1 Tax=Cohnella pontilimi TaxID=2564100 RepID=A0A4U0FDK2_9BACL|nr:methyl-accepting chemotaxis protein [Cohnella pontilimi]TJY42851.1 methyl-accepting chemotaxis protein [Cohnella pontilimi]